MLNDDFSGPADVVKTQILLIAGAMKEHADELMDMYTSLREATEVEQTPESIAIHKVFTESEQEGTHRKLLFAFHDVVYELHNTINSSELLTGEEILKLIKLTFDSERAYEKLRESGAQHVKRAKAAAKAAKARN